MRWFVTLAFGLCFLATLGAAAAAMGGEVPVVVPLSGAMLTCLLGIWETLLDIAGLLADTQESPQPQKTAQFALPDPTDALPPTPRAALPPIDVSGVGMPPVKPPPIQADGWKPPAGFR